MPGFADQVADEVKGAGYKIGKVGDTDTSFVETVVMYEPGMKAAARSLAGDLDGTLGRTSTQAIIPEVRGLAGKADLALVLGQDDAQSEGAAPAPETTTPETAAPETAAPETAVPETAPAPETAPVEPAPTG